MKQFQEHSTVGQLGILLTMMAGMGVPVFAGLLWASDKAVDEKYASDADVANVQHLVQTQVQRIETAVTANTAQGAQTAKSVDGLTLVVLDLQVRRLEAELLELESQKRQLAVNWSAAQERDLRDHQRSLEQLNAQRTSLFSRVANQ